jgi:DNA invertase Pin-like site-specific DNA recombinase
VFAERVSSVAPERPQLAAALDYVRDGDKLVVHRLDRLARNMGNLLEIVERLKAKGVALRCLDPEIDTSSATGQNVAPTHIFSS